MGIDVGSELEVMAKVDNVLLTSADSEMEDKPSKALKNRGCLSSLCALSIGCGSSVVDNETGCLVVVTDVTSDWEMAAKADRVAAATESKAEDEPLKTLKIGGFLLPLLAFFVG